jgi:hypothetical protein
LIRLVAIPFLLEHDRGHTFGAAICVIVEINFTERANGCLEKFLYELMSERLYMHCKGRISNLHLSFVHISREVGNDNFLDSLRGDTVSRFVGIC